MKTDDKKWMRLALQYARQAEQEGEVPVGAVIVKDKSLLAFGYNQSITHHDPSAHAEIQALRRAGQELKNYRLLDTTIYVTLEPCAMCLGAILHARVGRLVFAASDPRSGAVHSVFQIADAAEMNHRLDYYGGVLAEESSCLLKSFFKQRR
jgi:tRNA(adenine34) deaminase